MMNEPFTPPLGMILRQAHIRASRAFAEALRPIGLETTGAGLLLNLHQLGPLTQRQLIDLTGNDKSSMVRYIDGLEQRGLVRREPHPTDRRAHLVTPTDAGREVLARIMETAARTDRRLAQGLTPEEALTLRALLTRFATSPAPDDSPEPGSAT
ncbi:MarR family winged helix-turn-helix transcriptional regulator [Streptacidiphilus fuscans]|uniref:MarR family transcriptional regulator n=1 Tax=Streptacidiphilus fuscans TaxID=2789292 RepID=A0A931B4D5_9ACTN|nr:MarR family transcriptional regulator [Streptacidiphilus fuscans]MBF9070093.1 MarR family transcriptional regulator [Streptacidiphilus fuscans]